MDFHCLYSISQIDCKRCVVHSIVVYSNNLSKDLMRYELNPIQQYCLMLSVKS